ncbi:hypothetical protein AADZ90_011640 [Aestuariibius sp. 2305UL40-4]|uniref:hypothetical protein n=1 Tax=Aestuariibius violaceus TaxID=3234132 RepID=UPI00345EDE13
MVFSRSLVVLGMIALAGCAPRQDPQPRITPEPVFNKFGGGSCVPGYIYVPGAVPEQARCVPAGECEEVILADGSQAVQCTPPGDDCVETYNADGSVIEECGNPDRPRDDDDPERRPDPQDPRDPGRDPTGAPNPQ